MKRSLLPCNTVFCFSPRKKKKKKEKKIVEMFGVISSSPAEIGQIAFCHLGQQKQGKLLGSAICAARCSSQMHLSQQSRPPTSSFISPPFHSFTHHCFFFSLSLPPSSLTVAFPSSPSFCLLGVLGAEISIGAALIWKTDGDQEAKEGGEGGREEPCEDYEGRDNGREKATAGGKLF